MKIIFMGTPSFACASLERLFSDGHDVAGVFTQPDRPRNRGGRVSFSPVKETALKHAAQVYQPESLRDSSGAASEILRASHCDIIAVVAYGKLLPREVLELPPLGCINIHASLLPKYRGAAPIQWAIIKGEKETGVTSMYMAGEIDTGDIILKRTVAIGDDETADELSEALSLSAAGLLSDTLAAISGGYAVRIPQNHNDASFAPLISKDMSPINWFDTAFNIKCMVRGLCSRPGATAVIDGLVCKIFSVEINNAGSHNHIPGEIVSSGRHGIEIACADATVTVKELQAPGGKRMAAGAFVAGRPSLRL